MITKIKKTIDKLLSYFNVIRYKRLLLSSGLFDSSWYLEFYPDVAKTGISAITHFLKYGSSERRNPCPLFDSNYYLNNNPDVAELNINPLVHFLRYGHKENRKSHGIFSNNHTNSKQKIISIQTPSNCITKPRIACVVHAYYPEIFGELCILIKNIPKPFSLFISCPNANALSKVQNLAFRYGFKENVQYKISNNRGRNFGPFLCEFSDAIQDFDLVLHIHTKKSLYTGSDNHQWREYLYKSLIGSEYLVDIILAIFDNYPKVGLLYPSAFKNLPYWAHHWLSNREISLLLLKRLGIDFVSNSSYIDYPVGGMFWARVDAIRPLLSAKLCYADFPEEMGQTDGTLAHAIERTIGLISASQEYDFVEFEYDTGILKYNWSNRNLHQYHNNSIESYIKLLENIDIVSFDIFDTIFCRPSLDPDSVLKLVGHVLKGAHNQFDNYFFLRKEAEYRARQLKSFIGDVDIIEIYASYQHISSLSTDLITLAMDTELSIDLRICRLRTGVLNMLSAAKADGKRIIAISDTYYTLDYIKQLFKQNDISDYFDKIYLSTQHQARKDRGDLWDKLISSEEIPTYRWLHVGDNEQSDIQAACDHKINYFHLMRPSELLNLVGYKKTTKLENWATDLVMGPAMLRVAGNPFTSGLSFIPIKLIDAEDMGYTLFGSLFFTFISWLISHTYFKNISHIYFLSREGYLLQKLYDLIRIRYPNLNLPNSTYFFISRRTAISASLGIEFNIDKIIEGYGFTGTLSELLFSRIGYNLPDDFKHLDQNINLPKDRLTVMDALETLRNHIISHGASELHNLQDYCQSTGIIDNNNSAVVDIGYSATIQKSLQTIIGKGLIGFYFGTYTIAKEVNQCGGFAFGCFAENVPLYSTDNPFIRRSLFIESVLTAPHGQVSGYLNKNNGVIPVFGLQHHNNNALNTIKNLQLGALKYYEELINLYGVHLFFADIDKESPQEMIRLFIEGNLSITQDVLSDLSVEDGFCGNDIVNISKVFGSIN